MTKREDLRLATQIFNSQNILREKLIENGINFMLGIYGAPINETSLNEYRYYLLTGLEVLTDVRNTFSVVTYLYRFQ